MEVICDNCLEIVLVDHSICDYYVIRCPECLHFIDMNIESTIDIETISYG